MYTVEQVELIRRLRLTGINARQIIEAFNELDRLELDLKPNVLQDANASYISDSALNVFNGDRNGSNLISRNADFMASPAATSFIGHLNPLTNQIGQKSSPDARLAAMVDDLLNREDISIFELRDYVQQNQLRQHTIAQMCGVSQPYVSKFLSGNYKELSEKIRRVMFTWYASQLHGASAAEALQQSTIFDATFDTQKRERFIFKPSHTRLLLEYFEQNAYPNLEKRTQLSNELNRMYAEQCGKDVSQLDNKETVTEHLLATWFTNKRRETKSKGVVLNGSNENRRGRKPKFSGHLRQHGIEDNDQALLDSSVVNDDEIEGFAKHDDMDDDQGSSGFATTTAAESAN